MRTLTQIALVWMALAAGVCAAPPGRVDKAAEPGDALIHKRFKISLDDGAIMLPVKIDERFYRFILDTDFNYSCVDTSFSGKWRQIDTVTTPDTKQIIPLLKMPEARLGDIRLDIVTPEVCALDLSKLSEVAGFKLAGILGYDFFEPFVVQLDFDQEELRILKDVPADCGTKVDVDFNEARRPLIKIKVGDGRAEDFLLDTGCCGFTSGSLRPELFARLFANSKCRPVGKTLHETAFAETTSTRLWQTEELSVGEFITRQPIFSEGAENLLSLHYLSRFCVTFDFANRCIYLKEGKRFRQADQIDRSGLHIVRREGQAVVHSVDTESAASKADLRADDVILNLADVPGDTGYLQVMRRALCKPDADVPIVIRRDGKEFTISLHLAPAPAPTPVAVPK